MADEVKIKKDKQGQYILKMNIGGRSKDMIVDTGFSGEIFVDADNFAKAEGKDARGPIIEDATGRRTRAKAKTDVKCRIDDLDISVTKEVWGLGTGGSNLVGAEFFPNLAGLATAIIDLVTGELVIRKEDKGKKPVKPVEEKPVKVPFKIPEEEVKKFAEEVRETAVKVPFKIPEEERQKEF